jgi:hypothetical protein
MSSPMGPSGSGLAIKGSGSRAAEWCAGRPAPGARCTRFLVPPQHPAGWFQLLYVDPDVLPTTMAMRSPSPAAELGEDLGRAGHPGVVETVIGVPAGSTASGLHQPRPHVVRRGLDGDRSGGNEVGRFDHRRDGVRHAAIFPSQTITSRARETGAGDCLLGSRPRSGRRSGAARGPNTTWQVPMNLAESLLWGSWSGLAGGASAASGPLPPAADRPLSRPPDRSHAATGRVKGTWRPCGTACGGP